MRVLVSGGRDWTAKEVLFDTMNTLSEVYGPFTSLCHGGAQGVDKLAGAWAKLRGIPVMVFDADWARHGKGAGPRRNQEMLDKFEPQMAIFFPGGMGTADMYRRAYKAGVQRVKVEAFK
jgi:hypothetical protein